MKRAQVTIELVLLVGAVVFLVTIIIASVNFNTALAREKNEKEALEDFANYLQQELMLASKMHPFYAREFKLPEKILGKSYTIEVGAYYLVVGTSKFSVIRGIPFVKEGCRNFRPGEKNNITKTTEYLRINC